MRLIETNLRGLVAHEVEDLIFITNSKTKFDVELRAWKYLSEFDVNLERRCKMHKRRIDLLTPILDEINSQFQGSKFSHKIFKILKFLKF